MGLDQNWLVSDSNGNRESFAYHRKFNALEGYMAEIWYAMNGDTEETFNCQLLEVTAEMLDDLEATVEGDRLEPTAGFFFGSTEKDEWYREDVEELLEKVIPAARQHLAEGNAVYYTSWW